MNLARMKKEEEWSWKCVLFWLSKARSSWGKQFKNILEEQDIINENMSQFLKSLFVKAEVFIFKSAFPKHKLWNDKACEAFGECFLHSSYHAAPLGEIASAPSSNLSSWQKWDSCDIQAFFYPL